MHPTQHCVHVCSRAGVWFFFSVCVVCVYCMGVCVYVLMCVLMCMHEFICICGTCVCGVYV